MLGTATENARKLNMVPTGDAVPWDGGLAESEITRPGGTLLAALFYRADQLNQSVAQMADQMGVSYGYIAQLQNGTRAIESISPEFVKAVAQYLGVPGVTVLLLSCPVDAGKARHCTSINN